MIDKKGNIRSSLFDSSRFEIFLVNLRNRILISGMMKVVRKTTPIKLKIASELIGLKICGKIKYSIPQLYVAISNG